MELWGIETLLRTAGTLVVVQCFLQINKVLRNYTPKQPKPVPFPFGSGIAHSYNVTVPSDLPFALGDGAGGMSVQGGREYMEDRIAVIRGLAKGAVWFGVFDGHGGAAVSTFLSTRLPELLFSSSLNPYVAKEDDLPMMMKWAYLQADHEWTEMNKENPKWDGSTAVSALLIRTEGGGGWKVVVANVGDSRAVLCLKGDEVEELSVDHKPTHPGEKMRVEKLGGEISFHKGTWRVERTLAVTRAIGDTHLKPFVVAEPDIQTREIKAGEKASLILASDGLWDVISSLEAAQIIQHCSTKRAEDAAKMLTIEALRRGSKDNITVLVYFFQ